jgi:hypothetical protein
MAATFLHGNRPGRLSARVLAACLGVGLVLVVGLLTSPALAAAPSQPALTVSSVTASSATLSWTAATDDLGVVGYRVYRGPATPSTAPLTLITTADATVRSYAAVNLKSGVGYRFAVAALDADNNETLSAVHSVTTLTSSDKTPPAAVSSSSVALAAFSSSRVDVSWAAGAADVSYYEILRNGVVVGTVERPAATHFSDNGLAPGTTYSYSVRAVDSAGNRSAATTARSVATLAAGAVKIVRGPYAVRVTASSAEIVFWTNLATAGAVTFSGGGAASDTGTTEHQLLVSGLAAGTQYAYTVRSGAASATGTVRTAAAPGQPFTFAVIGDFGGGGPAVGQNAASIAGYHSEFLQTVGDNVYPSSGLPDPNFSTTYSDFDARLFKPLGGLLKSEAFFPANGNHEYYGDGEFWKAFPMPGANNSFYSYNWGDAHIVVLDSMRPFNAGSAQYSWVSRDLAGAAAQSVKWRIVVLPNPPYNTTTSVTGGSSQARAGLVPLFQQTHVNLVLSGDSHNYQRTKPLVNGAPVTTGGITYIVTGGGGNGLSAITGPMPAWEAFRQAVFETLKVQVAPTSLTVSAVSSTGAVLDSATLAAP